ncbi:MAG: AmmeMemoRadiSam system protein A [Firmicutes bacterium]|nr:AmmeMemoRadiSam system protein A [Bacillota bacterium]
MPVVIGCLVPHPPIIVPEVGRENIARVTSTIKAMEELSQDVAKANPETLVFVSPHSAGFADSIAVKASPVLKGSMANFGAFDVVFSVENDLTFIDELLRAANDYQLSITKVGRGFIDLLGSDELDHGIMVPLYYLRKHLELPIVSLSIDYRGFDEHYTLGLSIQQASESLPKRIALIASGDLSHRLIPGAPAGYNPRAVDFDARIEEIFDTGYFDELRQLDPALIESAGECGLRSIYALSGAFNNYEIRTNVLSYEAPFGVGYMVAAIYPGTVSLDRDLYTIQVEELPPKEPEVSEPVRLAKYSLEQYFTVGHPVKPPKGTSPSLLNKRAGVFVCLKIDDHLRGCVGTITPTQANIAEEIMVNAIQAATEDPRFLPVVKDELPKIRYSVDILDEPEKIPSDLMLDPKVYGVIVRRGYNTGLLLPNIDGVETVDEQIAIAKQKAGIKPHEEVELYRFKVTRYE